MDSLPNYYFWMDHYWSLFIMIVFSRANRKKLPMIGFEVRTLLLEDTTLPTEAQPLPIPSHYWWLLKNHFQRHFMSLTAVAADIKILFPNDVVGSSDDVDFKCHFIWSTDSSIWESFRHHRRMFFPWLTPIKQVWMSYR